MNPGVVANPEAVINAAIAANAAASAANQAFIMSMIILGAMVLVGLMMGIVTIRFSALEKNTNSMKDALVDATRKLALIEGRGLAKAEEDARMEAAAAQLNKGGST